MQLDLTRFTYDERCPPQRIFILDSVTAAAYEALLAADRRYVDENRGPMQLLYKGYPVTMHQPFCAISTEDA